MTQDQRSIKLNVGASPIWYREGWTTLDHKPPRDEGRLYIVGDADDIPLGDDSCSTIFCGHMIEHVPHTKLEPILNEFARVLEPGGIVRIVSPDLRKVTTAYVNNDTTFFEELLDEDENIRTDLGLGGMLMNCIVSPGQDTALFNRQLTEFIGGYAHLYLYDFHMLKLLLEKCGFDQVRQCAFLESEYEEYAEPLHVLGFEPEYHNLNQAYYAKHGLVHHYDESTGVYNINFKLTGFDRDPVSSLFVEARKKGAADQTGPEGKNYNRYGGSLMMDAKFRRKARLVTALAKVLDAEDEQSGA